MRKLDPCKAATTPQMSANSRCKNKLLGTILLSTMISVIHAAKHMVLGTHGTCTRHCICTYRDFNHQYTITFDIAARAFHEFSAARRKSSIFCLHQQTLSRYTHLSLMQASRPPGTRDIYNASCKDQKIFVRQTAIMQSSQHHTAVILTRVTQSDPVLHLQQKSTTNSSFKRLITA